MSTELKYRVMKVKFTGCVWAARKLDKKVTKEVADNHGTGEGAGKYNKNLLPKEIDPRSYLAVKNAVEARREEHYKQTVPSRDEGWRYLTSQNYFHYSEGHRKAYMEYEPLLETFLLDFYRLKEKSRRFLNGLFDEKDWPKDTDRLRKKFKFSCDFQPIADPDNFEVILGADHLASIKADIEEKQREDFAEAMRDPFRRYLEAVQHMREKLEDSDSIFRDSLVDNLRELVDLAPRLNLTGDQDLIDMTKKIEVSLCQFHPDVLRDNTTVRSTVAERARQIEKDLAAFYQPEVC